MGELLSIAQAGRRLRAGGLRARDLVAHCVERIARLDRLLQAWVLVDEEGARQAAIRLERELDEGRDRGPLHGIPVGVKDIIDVAGHPTRAGSPLRQGHLAAADAPLVAALREAGAVILGKTVTVEFACFDPSPSRNPWSPDLSHTPGGSSSGSAVALAAGMCFGALGTQTGGSLVRPASYCGVAALKPTYGSLPLEGVVPVSFHLDHPGPMARHVEDLQALHRCLPRANPFGPAELGPPAASEARAPESLLKPPRLGRVRGRFADEADPTITAATDDALQTLVAEGATIVDVRLPPLFADVLKIHGCVMAAEAAAYHRHDFAAHRDQFGPKIASLLDEGLSITAVDYAEALERLRHLRRHAAELVETFDALVMPATDTTAPPTMETTGDKKFQAPWSCSGLPVVSLPCGLARDGMPAALQLIGRPYEEGRLLAAARWCEQRLGLDLCPPMVRA